MKDAELKTVFTLRHGSKNQTLQKKNVTVTEVHGMQILGKKFKLHTMFFFNNYY